MHQNVQNYFPVLTSDLGICLSLDNTFKIANKATVVDKNGTHVKLMKGGILSVINEMNEIVAWVCHTLQIQLGLFVCQLIIDRVQRFCQSVSPAEIQEVLEGFKRRCEEIGVPLPEMVIVDNCCHVRSSIVKALPEVDVVLDVWHFLAR